MARRAALSLLLLGLLVPQGAWAQGGSYGVHLDSFGAEGGASAGWRQIKSRFPDLLDFLQPRFEPVAVSGRTMTRLIAGPLDRQQAETVCAGLKARGQYCRVVSQSGEFVPSAAGAATTEPAAEPAQATPPPHKGKKPKKGKKAAAIHLAPAPKAPAQPKPAATPRIEQASPGRFLYGRWARDSELCEIRYVTIAPERVTFTTRAGREIQDESMACKGGLADRTLTMRCEDGSTANFTLIGERQMVLRWVQSDHKATKEDADVSWSSCR